MLVDDAVLYNTHVRECVCTAQMAENRNCFTIVSQLTFDTRLPIADCITYWLPSKVFGNQAICRALVDTGGVFRISGRSIIGDLGALTSCRTGRTQSHEEHTAGFMPDRIAKSAKHTGPSTPITYILGPGIVLRSVPVRSQIIAMISAHGEGQKLGPIQRHFLV